MPYLSSSLATMADGRYGLRFVSSSVHTFHMPAIRCCLSGFLRLLCKIGPGWGCISPQSNSRIAMKAAVVRASCMYFALAMHLRILLAVIFLLQRALRGIRFVRGICLKKYIASLHRA